MQTMNMLGSLLLTYVLFLLLGQPRAGHVNVLVLKEEKLNKLEKKQVLCGNKITQIMDVFCIVFNSPAGTEHRVRRQIVDECCYKACSISHIVDFYCEKSNREALERYLSSPDEDYNFQGGNAGDAQLPQGSSSTDPELSPVRRQRDDSGVATVSLPREPSPSTGAQGGRRRKPRNRRYCPCKKHRDKKSKRNRKSFDEIHQKRTVPEPKIGQIEDSQRPFYVLSNYKRWH